MDQGYYHIFDLSGLTIDERRFIGSMCLTFSQLAMLSREDLLSQGKAMPLHPIIVDEAPTFMDQSADAIQSFADEARKYNVPLVLGMQGLEGQVPDQVASAIFRNFGTLIAFRVGNTEDAETIYQGMKADYLKVEDYQQVEPNYAYMRMAIGRETTLPFLVKMNPPEHPQYTDDIPQMIEQTLSRATEMESRIQAGKRAAEEEEVLKEKELIEAFEEGAAATESVALEDNNILRVTTDKQDLDLNPDPISAENQDLIDFHDLEAEDAKVSLEVVQDVEQSGDVKIGEGETEPASEPIQPSNTEPRTLTAEDFSD